MLITIQRSNVETIYLYSPEQFVSVEQRLSLPRCLNEGYVRVLLAA